MFCPKCKSEYDAGYTVCTDCHVELVDVLPEEPSAPENTGYFFGNEVMLIIAEDKSEAQVICRRLEDNNILNRAVPSTELDGGYDIYIPEANLFKAGIIIDKYLDELEAKEEE